MRFKFLKRGPKPVNPNQVPWYKNAFGFAMTGVGVGLVILGAEVYLIMQGRADGLPEQVATPLFGLSNALIGYAGGCIQARVEKPAPLETDE